MISIRNITKKYKSNIVLNNVTIDFDEKLTFLVGENGVGKSTLINILAGIVKPSCGKIFIDSEEITFKKGSYKRKIGFLLNLPTYPYNYKLKEYILLLNYIYKIDITLNKLYQEDLINFFELNKYLDYQISELSTGYIQRVKLLSAMLHKPKLYIFDEPFIGLDIVFKKKLFKRILRLSKNNYFLVVSHDKDIEIFKNTGTFYSILNGKINKELQIKTSNFETIQK